MEYEIRMGKEVIGTANVERQGLYYHFSCRCRLSGTVMYRVLVTGGGHSENLGVLVPMGDVFGLEKKVPVKHLGTGALHFQAMAKHQKPEGKFVPIRPEEPFSYIARLQEAFLEIREGQVGAVLR